MGIKIKNKLTSLFSRPITSKDADIESFRQYLLHYLLLSLAIFTYIAYFPSVYLALKEKLYDVVILDTLVIGFISFLLFKKLSFHKKAISLLIVFYLLGLGLLITVGPAGAGPLWLLLFSIMTSVLLGARPVVISLGINILTWAFLSIFVYLKLFPWMTALPNPSNLWVIIGVNFICVNSIAAVSVSALINQISKMFHHEKEVGTKLKQEIQTRTETEKKNRELLTKLHQSQKLEAIGTLAGGVAHDLNNVLSAQVGYPDLLLMDIPEGSPLIEPLLNIKESGEKACAIVQDLLTMARRGVFVEAVIDINQIIENYIRSRECEKMKSFHPDVKISVSLDKKLNKIVGSEAHIFNVIMNLVNNAAEAMPIGGEIQISSFNQYLENPVKEYDDFKKGDFAILSVSDTGTGIAQKDIEKIFEPFYTKKKMGRSGTGLGMYVVRETIRDHKGYIDVQSMENAGTVFTIYFPATDKKEQNEEKSWTMHDCMGNGESVLVVDDEKKQCKLVTDMLTKLNYSVSSVENGEKAIEYMYSNAPDLVILDMLMEPGIDGCETFEQILKIHPEQKAIIASGFSENDRVKKAQSLGAGAYIKKPYTIEKIGIAVKNVLETSKQSPFTFL